MEEKEKPNFIYIVRCADGTLYTGWTTDLDGRMAAHNSGAGAKYTRGRGPVSLLYSEVFETKGEALKRESQIKKLTRTGKLKLAGMAPDKIRRNRTPQGMGKGDNDGRERPGKHEL